MSTDEDGRKMRATEGHGGKTGGLIKSEYFLVPPQHIAPIDMALGGNLVATCCGGEAIFDRRRPPLDRHAQPLNVAELRSVI